MHIIEVISDAVVLTIVSGMTLCYYGIVGMKLLKTISFGLLGGVVLFMIVATLLEKQYGTAFAVKYVYGASWFVGCWAVVALSSLVYLWKSGVGKRPVTLLLHLSFVVILLGALITHVFGVQGSVHLRQEAEAPVRTFQSSEGAEVCFPFAVQLKDFNLEYYPGTSAPMDFVSVLAVTDGEETAVGEVSMNHIYSYRSYRFYQSRYDSDGKGSVLAVAYDPWGIAVTYLGYALLLLSICLFFFGRQSRFRALLRHPLLKSAAVCLLLLVFAGGKICAQEVPPALPKKTAEAFGNLYVYYNDRICPLQTLAKDFTVKLYGKPGYKGLSAEQVLTGWFFYYDSWKKEPCIRIKSKEVQRMLGIKGQYASLSDFADIGGYKLDKERNEGMDLKDRRGLEEANEKFSLVSMVAAGSIWKLYPYMAEDTLIHNPKLVWYSITDRLPYDLPQEQRSFVRGSLSYASELLAAGDFGQVNVLLEKIRKFQMRQAGDFLPSEAKFKAEKCYNTLNNSRPLAMIAISLGLLTFIYYCRCMVCRKKVPAGVTGGLLSILGVVFVYLGLVVALRGFISGHVPMSNGHEAMQLMALCVVLLTFCFYRRMALVVSFGFLLSGLALLVSMLGESNPQITQLMPVLASPLLSLHVMVIMIAYALLAFVMLNGVAAVVFRYSRKECRAEIERLQIISHIILYPAVFLLAIGIFIGAVWANVSWGRYWGWDPKEVWALITMLVYALALHPASLPWFRRPMFFHVFSILAFFSVLITYFGVNFLLGGMHSYA